jgi:hypothetical protein
MKGGRPYSNVSTLDAGRSISVDKTVTGMNPVEILSLVSEILRGSYILTYVISHNFPRIAYSWNPTYSEGYGRTSRRNEGLHMGKVEKREDKCE